MMKRIVLTLLMLLLVVGVTPVLAQPQAQADQTIMEYLAEDGRFATLVQSIEMTGVIDELAGEGPFTVFAPTDQAFDNLSDEKMDQLMNDTAMMEETLRYHVVEGQLMKADLANKSSVETLAEWRLNIHPMENDMLAVNDGVLIETDIETANGVIHVVDSVLLKADDQPEVALEEEGEMAEEGEMMEEEAAAEEGEMTEEGEMMEEAAAEEGQMAEEGEVSSLCSEDYVVQEADWLSKIADKFFGNPQSYPVIVQATNAAAAASDEYTIIEDPNRIEIGQVLCIPVRPDAEALMSEEVMMTEDESETTPGSRIDLAVGKLTGEALVDATVLDNQFAVLVDALERAGMLDMLNGEEPYTLFAPTDAAFAALPPEAMGEMMESETQQLQDLLSYHLVPGKMTAAAIQQVDTLETALGQTITVIVEGETVMVNDAQVINPNHETTNGMIHVVDSVLVPLSLRDVILSDRVGEDEMVMGNSVIDVLEQDERFDQFVAFLETTQLDQRLESGGPYTIFAPTDAAFDKFSEDELNELQADSAALLGTLEQHIVEQQLSSSDLAGQEMIEGTDLTISASGDMLMVNEANIVATDITASNGVIHAIDAVLPLQPQ